MMNHFVVMFFIMLLSGSLSTMNMWAMSWDDVYFSLNDVYMILLMTGWMFVFMGVYYKNLNGFMAGAILCLLSFTAIRQQLFITEDQYLKGMIPHHSMALLMSQKLQEKPNSIQALLKQIIESQTREIAFMKTRI